MPPDSVPVASTRVESRVANPIRPSTEALVVSFTFDAGRISLRPW